MIQVIAGNKGSGKTKRLIDIANEALKEAHGIVAFIDDDKRYMYDLRHEVRFVDASDYPAIKGSSADVFLGFLSGMIASNFDLSVICVDSFLKLCKKTPLSEMEAFFENLNRLPEAGEIKFIFNVSSDADTLPEFMKPYLI